MRTVELDYELPARRIATEPARPRDAARLMVVHRDSGRLEHHRVRDLPQLGVLRAGDLLVVNQTRVLPAYFAGTRAATGGRIRGLYLACPDHQHWLVMLESGGHLREGERITLSAGTSLTLLEATGGGCWKAKLDSGKSTLQVLQEVGQPPLPPYIRKARRLLHEPEIRPDDSERYNTVYAQEFGSVAAPTAGLHFTPGLLEEIARSGVGRAHVTLHVGIGTFAPVRTEELAAHQMHSEQVRISATTIEAIIKTRAAGGRIIPIGTTTVRALESLPEPVEHCRDGYEGATELFIMPGCGFRFRFADGLLTNFHLPRSTLLAMVAALPGVGIDNVKAWYRIAVDQGYRFYSYGDAMLIV
jgi:S-adenosylmethionine:tRNA ribosyltransferase-isomerase